jgi:hypothetical protein
VSNSERTDQRGFAEAEYSARLPGARVLRIAISPPLPVLQLQKGNARRHSFFTDALDNVPDLSKEWWMMPRCAEFKLFHSTPFSNLFVGGPLIENAPASSPASFLGMSTRETLSKNPDNV